MPGAAHNCTYIDGPKRCPSSLLPSPRVVRKLSPRRGSQQVRNRTKGGSSSSLPSSRAVRELPPRTRATGSQNNVTFYPTFFRRYSCHLLASRFSRPYQLVSIFGPSRNLSIEFEKYASLESSTEIKRRSEWLAELAGM